MAFPAGFWWGTGASSNQCEGAAPASTWTTWERGRHAPPSGDGNGFASRYAEDFALLASLGLTHHRLSIEWARIEPVEGERDPEAIEHYRRVLEGANDAGVHPWVCLHHFTVPQWFADAGGFTSPVNRANAWHRHVEFVAETFGDLVYAWKPVNEPAAYAATGWLGMGFYPGRNDYLAFFQVLEAIQLATIDAGRWLRATGKPVATIHNLSSVHEVGEGAALPAAVLDGVLWGSWLSALQEGAVQVPTREPVEVDDANDAFDLIGFSYYSAQGITSDGVTVPYPSGQPVSPLGYAIWPPGLRLVLDRLHHELPDRPLLICEYGLGTHDDEQRAQYLRDGLGIVSSAIDDGIDVRGLFHWTAVDNYEWLLGDRLPFGIIDRQRNVKPSAEVLRAAATA